MAFLALPIKLIWCKIVSCHPITVNWVLEKVGYLFANMLLPQTLVSDSGLPTYMYMYMDTQMLLIPDIGDKMLLALWDDASSDATGLFARSQKLAGTIEQVTSRLYINSSSFTLCNDSLVKRGSPRTTWFSHSITFLTGVFKSSLCNSFENAIFIFNKYGNL